MSRRYHPRPYSLFRHVFSKRSPWLLGLLGCTIALGGSGLSWANDAAIARQTGKVAESAEITTLTKPGQHPVVWENLSPLDVHPRTSLTIVEQLRHNHFLKKPLDDDLSAHILDKYLGMLDGGRAYFVAADIEEFEKYRFGLDDALKRGNLDPAFQIFNRFQERLIQRLEYLLNQLDADKLALDFTVDEDIEIDRSKAPWPADTAALDELWRTRLKAAVLSMKLNNKPMDEIQTLLQKRYKNRLKQTLQTKSEDAFQLYVNAFAASYDPHTQYFSPRTSQNFNINMSLSLEGIGAVLSTEDEYTSIVRLVPAGPADKTGLIKPADRIVSVGQGDEGPLIDVVGWRLDDVVELIRGPKGTRVRLEIIRDKADSEAVRVIEITRNTVQLEEQAAQKKLITMDRGGRPYKIGIIEIPTFYVDFQAIQKGDPNFKSTTRDVIRLIDELKTDGADGLVIDLRNNGGGSLQEADALTGLFIKSGPTVQVKSARRQPSIYADTDDSVAWDGPLAVVVNRLSASASEIFAGAIQDYKRGLVIGSQTFGKGTVQTLIPLNRGQLKVTAAKFYRVSGQSTQHRGVMPDIHFPELYDIDIIGESALEDAMPWDMINAAVYPLRPDLDGLVTELNSRHETRVSHDPDFKYLNALALKSHENSQRTHLSLHEATRRAEKNAEDIWRLDLENQLRKAKHEPLITSLDELDAVDEAVHDQPGTAPDDSDEITLAGADSSTDTPEQTKEPDTLDHDALMRETGNILMDYISLSRQIASVGSVPTAGLSVEGKPQLVQ